MLGSKCQSCHAATPIGGAPMPLMTLSDLTKPAVSDPTKKVADVSLVRIQDNARPMPPAGLSPATATEISALQTWIANGYGPLTCTGSATTTASNPYNTPTVCTSNQFYAPNGDGSSRMEPGNACIACHQSTGGEAPSFAFAGTVYPSAHEPADCYGVAGGATVRITGADGNTVTIAVNSAGNFYYRGSVALPFTAAVVSNGKMRVMSTPESSGDCNSCHTASGMNGAPGRVMLP
jgi:hypothetical protein